MGCKRKTESKNVPWKHESLTCCNNDEPEAKRKMERHSRIEISNRIRLDFRSVMREMVDLVCIGDDFAVAETLLTFLEPDLASAVVRHRFSDYEVTLFLTCAYTMSPRLPHSFLVRIVVAGGDTHAVDSDGNNFLHLLVRRKRTEDLKSILEAVDCPIYPQISSLVDCRNDTSRTPLHLAVLNEDLTAMKALIDAGANVNARSSCDWTALHYAVVSSCPEDIVRLLLTSCNIDVNATDAGGRTALDISYENENNDEVISLLESHGGQCLYESSSDEEFRSGEEESDDECSDGSDMEERDCRLIPFVATGG